MNKKISKYLSIILLLFVGFFITMTGVLALAFCLLLFPVSEETVDAGILVLYVLSCLAAGRIWCKRRLSKRILGGILIGMTYYLILLLTAVLGGVSTNVAVKDVITSMMICGASGALGGRLS